MSLKIERISWFQSPGVQSSSVQSSRVQISNRPESKHPDHASRAQLFRYAEFLDSGSKWWMLDARLWKLQPGRCTLDAGFCTLDTVVDWFRTESEPSFRTCLINLLKSLWVRISMDLMVMLIL